MSKIYSPRIVTDSLVMCLDASQNKSYPTTDLPVKGGLALWLDAADDTAFSYSSGTSVSQWRDKSGNNFHASQATLASQPSRSTFQNSRKTVNFDGTNDTVTIPNFVCNSEMSIFVVSNCGTTLFIEHSTDTNSNSGFYLGGQGTGMFAINRSPGIIYINNANWLSGGYSIACGVNSSGLDLLTYKDGAQQSITLDGRSARTNSYATSTLYIGSRGANSIWSNGPIAEIIIYNRKVTNAERNLIHTYLGQKWGISNTDRSIIDLSGFNDNGLLGNGTVANMPIYDYYNKGLKFNSTNANYVKVGVNSSLQVNTVTIAAFFKTITNGQTTQFIGGYGDTGFYGYWLGMTGGPMVFSVGNSTSNLQLSSTITPNNDQIYYVVGTYDGVTQRIYVDGVLKNSATTVTGVLSYSGLTDGFLIGQVQGFSVTRYMTGSIYAMQVYSRALSAAEVAQNYETMKSKFANTIVQQGLVLNLDAGNPYSYAGAGTTWIDVSGAVNDFAAVGSPTYSTNEFILNGTTQYFSLFTAASGFFINNTNNFYADVGYAWSISVWFKFPVAPTSVRDATVGAGNCSYCMFGNGGGIGGAETLALFVSGISGTYAGVHPYYCMVGLRGGKTQLSLGSVNTNTWNNVVVTWDGSASRGYFNGVDRGALTSAGQGMQINGYTIGSQAGGSSVHLFEGSISQTFVYSRAISAAEVLQNYNALKGRFGL